MPIDSDPLLSWQVNEAQECLVPTDWHVLGSDAKKTKDMTRWVIAGMTTLPEVHLNCSFSVTLCRPALMNTKMEGILPDSKQQTISQIK